MHHLEATAFFPTSDHIWYKGAWVSPARYELFGFKNAEMFHLDGEFLSETFRHFQNNFFDIFKMKCFNISESVFYPLFFLYIVLPFWHFVSVRDKPNITISLQ